MRSITVLVIALLTSFFVTGVSSGQMMAACCHKDAAGCSCEQHPAVKSATAGQSSPDKKDDCMSGSCGEFSCETELLITADVSPLQLPPISEKKTFTRPWQQDWVSLSRLGFLPPPSPSPPLYTMHCSFLI